MPDLIKIPLASTEIQARFEQPCIGFIGLDRPRAVEAIVSALLPFNFRLANSDTVGVGNFAEQKTTFKIPERGITFQFGAEDFRFTKEGSYWETAQEDAEVLVAAEQALMQGSSAKVKQSTINVAMHLQLLTRPRAEVMSPFFPEPFRALLKDSNASTYGTHLKWATGDVLLDFSAAYANGLFVRFSSQLEGYPPLIELLTTLRKNEDEIFSILGVQEANPAP